MSPLFYFSLVVTLCAIGTLGYFAFDSIKRRIKAEKDYKTLFDSNERLQDKYKSLENISRRDSLRVEEMTTLLFSKDRDHITQIFQRDSEIERLNSQLNQLRNPDKHFSVPNVVKDISVAPAENPRKERRRNRNRKTSNNSVHNEPTIVEMPTLQKDTIVEDLFIGTAIANEYHNRDESIEHKIIERYEQNEDIPTKVDDSNLDWKHWESPVENDSTSRSNDDDRSSYSNETNDNSSDPSGSNDTTDTSFD